MGLRFRDAVTSLYASLIHSNKRTPMLIGQPGGGKTACVKEVAKLLCAHFGIGYDRIIMTKPSAEEPTDMQGMPILTGTHVQWLPVETMYKMRFGEGIWIWLIDELSDASVQVQNVHCGPIYDRVAGQTRLSDDLIIMATGNRVEDRSGANRLTTKLANRLSMIEFESHHEDLIQHAIDQEWDPIQIQFHKFRPALVNEFKPERLVNPTSRSWERVNMIPGDLPTNIYMEHVKAEVGEGAAAEYTSFRKIAKDLPDIDDILADPKKAYAPPSTEPATLWALCGSLARHVKATNIDNLETYLKRLPPEFAMMVMRDIASLQPNLTATKAFGRWAAANKEVLG